MAINKTAFRTRALTAAVFAAVMMAGLFINIWSFIILCMLIICGCFYEFLNIARRYGKRKYYACMLIAPFYIVMPMLMMMMLGIHVVTYTASPGTTDTVYNPLLPCVAILSIWINDTMAYVVGSWIGKTPFSKISPKKTWEGTIGGAVLSILVMGLVGWLLPGAQVLPVRHWVCLAAICSVFGTAGDLLESKLKRMAGIKDSGSFMPGHGGFLDRFDSLLIALPFVWLYAELFIL